MEVRRVIEFVAPDSSSFTFADQFAAGVRSSTSFSHCDDGERSTYWRASRAAQSQEFERRGCSDFRGSDVSCCYYEQVLDWRRDWRKWGGAEGIVESRCEKCKSPFSGISHRKLTLARVQLTSLRTIMDKSNLLSDASLPVR